MHLLINTGGGDAPGLNAVIRSVTLSALRRGFRVTGIRRGYSGLLQEAERGLVALDRDLVRGIIDRGGTILGTVSHGQPFEHTERAPDGSLTVRDESDRVLAAFRKLGADGLIAVGGDGSLSIAARFQQKGMPVIVVPKTIDAPSQSWWSRKDGAQAVRLAAAGKWGRMVSWQPPRMASVSFDEALARPHAIAVDDDCLAMGRDFGVCFGDGGEPGPAPRSSAQTLAEKQHRA